MPGNVLTATIKVNTQGVKEAFDGTAQAATKAKTSLAGTDDIVNNIISSSHNLNDALKKLSSQGLLSVNSLQGSINDFKKAFNAATNPADIKRFGDALKVLQQKQQELINSGLGVESVGKKITASHGANTVATQRLSSSVLGLANVFDALPPELSHVTHGFDQILQSYERISHGSESTGDAVKKFAGALGGVGLGLAISVLAGLIVSFVSDLIEMSKGFSDAELSAAAFRRELEEVDKSIRELSVISDFTAQVEKLQAQIKFGSGFKSNIIGDEAEIKNNTGKIETLTQKIEELTESFSRVKNSAPFQGLSEKAKELVSNLFAVGENVDNGLLGKLKEKDKDFVTELADTNEKIAKLQNDRQALQLKTELLQGDILLQKADEARKNIKKAFEQIRAGFVEGQHDLTALLDLNPSKLSLPFQLALDENKLTIQFSALNEQLRLKLKEFELRASTVPLVIKQQIQVDPNLVVPARIRKEVEDEIRSQFASDVPLKVDLNGNIEINLKGQPIIDVKKVLQDLQRELANASSQFAKDTLANIGNVIGDAISGSNLGDAFKAFGKFLANGLESFGKALIAAGVKMLLAKQAVSKLFANPAIAIAAGIALIVLSRILQNSLGNQREKGGSVYKGKLYEVNERGRELFQPSGGKPYLIAGGRQFFTPPTSGKIIPNWQTEKILQMASIGKVRQSFSDSLGKFSGYRAGGGAVVAGNNYIVNEAGREIFIPNTGQSVSANQPSANIKSGGITVKVTGGVEIAGNKLIAVLANAGRNQKVFV